MKMKNMLSAEQMAQRARPRTEDVRGPYFRDQTAIIHSTPFRRLKHKTQVFFAPENDHVCTRIEHVLHVATIAATICRGLGRQGWELDMELAYAAGIGHDLGHTPFGHSGERALSECSGKPFSHEVHSLRVVDKLTANGAGLNLTFAVRDAVLCHNGEHFEQYLEPCSETDLSQKLSGDRIPATWEGCAVRFADKIAYLGRDIEDSLLAGFITLDDVPREIRSQLGSTNGEIINTLVIDIIENSAGNAYMGFSDEKFRLITKLRDFNYDNIYRHKKLYEYQRYYCTNIISSLHGYLNEHFDEITTGGKNDVPIDDGFRQFRIELAGIYGSDAKTDSIIDYIAGMTDNFALSCFKDITLPRPIEFKV